LGFKNLFEALKAFGDVLIRFAVIGVVLAAVFLPANFAARLGDLKQALNDAGFDFAVNVAGLSLTERAVQQQLSDNTETLSQLRSQVTTLEDLLRCQSEDRCTDVQAAQLAAYLGADAAVVAEADAAIRRNEALLSEAATREEPPPPVISSAVVDARWAVVAGSDLTLEAARFEARRMPERYDTMIVQRGRWYVTVALFETEAAARAAVPEVAAALDREPFVRAFATWCPSPTDGPEGIPVCAV
jgi:hypothetical protein